MATETNLTTADTTEARTAHAIYWAALNALKAIGHVARAPEMTDPNLKQEAREAEVVAETAVNLAKAEYDRVCGGPF